MTNTRITTWLLVITAAAGFWVPPTEAQEHRVRRAGKRIMPGLTQPAAKRLTASDAERSDQFGWSVAIHGNRLAVCAINAEEDTETDPENTGAVVIFTRNQEGTWSELQILSHPGPEPERNNYFGQVLALSDDHLFVGVPAETIGEVSQAGSVFVYSWNRDSFDETPQHIFLEDPAENAFFGMSLAVEGETAIIGASRAGENEEGVAFVYDHDGSSWRESQQLTPSDWLSGMGFGASTALSEDWLVVGAPGDFGGDQNQIWGAGSAYVFYRNDGTWVEHQKLRLAEPAGYDGFGFPVAISGSTILISATGEGYEDNADAGAVYIFTESSGNWDQEVRLNRPIPSDGAKWGWATAISGDTATIGFANTPSTDPPYAGVVDIYTRTKEMWRFSKRIASPKPVTSGSFGFSLAQSDSDLLIGAPMEDALTEEAPGFVWDAGAAYVYTMSSLKREAIESRAVLEAEGSIGSQEDGGE